MNEMRVMKLDGCNVWRVERLAQPVWGLRWLLKPRWVPMYRMTLFLREVVAEYDSLLEANAAMQRFMKYTAEADARTRNRWREVWAGRSETPRS